MADNFFLFLILVLLIITTGNTIFYKGFIDDSSLIQKIQSKKKSLYNKIKPNLFFMKKNVFGNYQTSIYNILKTYQQVLNYFRTSNIFFLVNPK